MAATAGRTLWPECAAADWQHFSEMCHLIRAHCSCRFKSQITSINTMLEECMEEMADVQNTIELDGVNDQQLSLNCVENSRANP